MSSTTLSTPSAGGVQAFQASTVVAPFKAVECVEAYNDTILAGLGDGTLISFVQSQSTTAHNAPPQPWEVAQVIKGFGKAYLRQMQVIAGRGQPHARLLSLCEEGVNVHRLPECTLQCQADRTRLATRYSRCSPRLCALLAPQICMGCRHFHAGGRRQTPHRHVHLDGSDLVALREFALADIPVDIAWCGANICIATAKNECVAVDSPVRPHHVPLGTACSTSTAAWSPSSLAPGACSPACCPCPTNRGCCSHAMPSPSFLVCKVFCRAIFVL